MSLYGKAAATGTVKYHTIPMVIHNLSGYDTHLFIKG